jgi:hypothetical protein
MFFATISFDGSCGVGSVKDVILWELRLRDGIGGLEMVYI